MAADLPTYWKIRSLFLRGLAIVYFCAFGSLWMQIIGLIGHEGILPVDRLMEQAHRAVGLSWYRLPTLAWISGSDAFLHLLCGGGFALAVIAFFECAPLLLFSLLWIFYLSLVSVGGDFLGFQWDNLLLETGLVAVLWAPLSFSRSRESHAAPTLTGLFLLRWLLFRLMFQSGLVKWLSGDPTWRHFTALEIYYETMPLPNPLSWVMHQLPPVVQKISVGFVFFAELILPWLIWGPRQWRRVAFFGLAGLQILILLTGNYAFFNGLTLLLCLALLDDRDLAWLKLKPATSTVSESTVPRLVRRSAGAVIFGLGFLKSMAMLGVPIPSFLQTPVSLSEPFRSVNNYGLFASMTTTRPEIIMEGSDDGKAWLDYEFKFKPQALDRRPAFVAPYQPRLDWQMWFAALSDANNNPWFLSFCRRLLEGSPSVESLLRTNPFPLHPPRYLRASVYEYHFTSIREHHATERWWRREYKGLYCPVLSLTRP